MFSIFHFLSSPPHFLIRNQFATISWHSGDQSDPKMDCLVRPSYIYFDVTFGMGGIGNVFWPAAKFFPAKFFPSSLCSQQGVNDGRQFLGCSQAILLAESASQFAC
jgi:hypothetical protein